MPEEQKEAFVAGLRGADTKEARGELFRKFNITLSDEEKAALKEVSSTEVSDEELDQAAGGCCCGVSCQPGGPCLP